MHGLLGILHRSVCLIYLLTASVKCSLSFLIALTQQLFAYVAFLVFVHHEAIKRPKMLKLATYAIEITCTHDLVKRGKRSTRLGLIKIGLLLPPIPVQHHLWGPHEHKNRVWCDCMYYFLCPCLLVHCISSQTLDISIKVVLSPSVKSVHLKKLGQIMNLSKKCIGRCKSLSLSLITQPPMS